jgi:hypothetical protein
VGEDAAGIEVLLLALAFAALLPTGAASGAATTAATLSLPSVAGGMLRCKIHDALFSPAGEREHCLR